MKKVLLVFAAIMFLMSCHKDKSNNYGPGIAIKGNLPTSTSRSLSSTNSFSIADARRVLVFYGESFTTAEIKDGKFSTTAPMGTAAALIFLDGSNHYIGNLYVSGLNMLPLVNLTDKENTVIDLAGLSLDGTSVLPENNPIGKQIGINQEEVSMYQELGSYFQALAKNIDTDNDGIPDNFAGKELYLNTDFNVHGGTFGLNSNAPVMRDASQLSVDYELRIKGWKSIVPSNLNISFSGPEGDPYTDIVKDNYEYNDGCGCFNVFFSRRNNMINDGSAMHPFKPGIYTFTMDGVQKYTLSYSNINAKYFLILGVPTLKTNSDGKVVSVSIDWMKPDKTPADQSKFITTMMLQFKNSNNNEIYKEGSIFDTSHKLPDFTNVTLSNPVRLGDIQDLNVSYTDLVGNIYNIFWSFQ